MYPVKSGIGCVISTSKEMNKKFQNTILSTIVRHRQNGNLGNGTISAFDSTSSLINGRQIRVHVPRIPTSAGHFLSRSGHLTQGISIRAHVRQNDQDVLLSLVGEVLCGGESEARGNDTLDGGVIRKVQEQAHSLQGSVLFEIFLEEGGGVLADTHRTKNNGEVVLVRVKDSGLMVLDQTSLAADLGGDVAMG